MGFGRLDLIIVVAFLAGVTLLGAYFRRHQHDINDYFLGRRTTPWWAISLSIVATETSTLTIIGIPALAYGSNMAFLQLALGYIVARFLISFLLLPQYFRGELLTAYQYIERRFGEVTRRLAAALFLVTRALADAVRLWAIAIVVQLVLPRVIGLFTDRQVRVAELTAVLVVMSLTLLFTFLGGMKAVIWTDVVLFFIYIGGGLVSLWLLLEQVPYDLVQSLAADKLTFLDFSFAWDKTYTFWAGLLGGTFLSMASHGTDQLMVQRLLAARNLRESRRALIASGFIVFGQFVLFLLIGVWLYVFYQLSSTQPGVAFDNPDRIFPTFMVTHLPTGLSGLMVAGVLAAAMSTSSSTLNSLAASTVVDFHRLFGSGTVSPAQLLRRSRWVTLAWGGVLVALAMLARGWGSVLEAGLAIASITYGSLLGLFLLGRLVPRATPTGAAAGMLAGLVLLLYVKFFTNLAWTWYVLVGTLATFLVGWLLSIIRPAPEDA